MTTINKLITGSVILSMLLLLAGCRKDASLGTGDTPSAPADEPSVIFSLSTGVETYSQGPIPAKDYEKNYKAEGKTYLQMLLFDGSDTFFSIAKFKELERGGEHYGLKIEPDGAYTLLVVANLEIEEARLKGKTLQEVQQLVVSSEPGVRDRFVMVSQPHKFNVLSNRLTDLGTVTLTRLAARIDIQTTLSKLTFTKVTVKNRKKESTLLASTDTDQRGMEEKSYDSFYLFDPEAASSRATLGQIYTYENSRSARKGSDDLRAKGTTVVIEGTYGGKEITPVEVPLPQVKRNCIYSIYLIMDNTELDPGKDPDDQVEDKPEDPSKLKLDFVIEVLDWQTGETINISPEEIEKQLEKQRNGVFYEIKTTPVPLVSDLGVKNFDLNISVTRSEYRNGNLYEWPRPITEGITYEVSEADKNPWLTVSQDGKITVAENDSPAPRSAYVQITVKKEDSDYYKGYKTIKVTQSGALKYNPLAYMAVYNVTKDKTWDTAHSIPEKTELKSTPLFMKWQDAKDTFGSDATIESSKESYHLPSLKEWVSILPKDVADNQGANSNRNHWVLLFHPDKNAKKDVSDEVMIGETSFTGTSDYLPATLVVNGKLVNCNVALRFKGDGEQESNFRSAWLYFIDHTPGRKGMQIYCLNIFGDESIKQVEDLNQSFWNSRLSKAVTRFLPAIGSSNGKQHENAYYWSSTDKNGAAWHGYFSVYTDKHPANARVTSSGKNFGRGVRLFSKTPVRE